MIRKASPRFQFGYFMITIDRNQTNLEFFSARTKFWRAFFPKMSNLWLYSRIQSKASYASKNSSKISARPDQAEIWHVWSKQVINLPKYRRLFNSSWMTYRYEVLIFLKILLVWLDSLSSFPTYELTSFLEMVPPKRSNWV